MEKRRVTRKNHKSSDYEIRLLLPKLYSEERRKLIFRLIVYSVFSVFIVGYIVSAILSNSFILLPLLIIFLIPLIITAVFYSKLMKSYREIIIDKKMNDVQSIIAKLISSDSYFDHYQRLVAIAALEDLRAEAAISTLNDILQKPIYGRRSLRESLQILEMRYAAWALGRIGSNEAILLLSEFENHYYESVRAAVKWALEQVRKKLAAEQLESGSRDVQLIGEAEDITSFELQPTQDGIRQVIVSKVKRDEGSRVEKVSVRETIQISIKELDSVCMISGIRIHLGMGEIAACPHCGNLAKGDLLEKWLQTKNICPVCKRPLRFETCPIVTFQEN